MPTIKSTCPKCLRLKRRCECDKAELRAALEKIADSYTSEMYDRPLAYKMSRIARDALRKSEPK